MGWNVTLGSGISVIPPRAAYSCRLFDNDEGGNAGFTQGAAHAKARYACAENYYTICPVSFLAVRHIHAGLIVGMGHFHLF